MPETVILPELARSLRAFGAARDPASEAAHAAVFTPLLDARARAAMSGLDGALSAFRGQPLAARIVARSLDAARVGETDPARARARAARAREAVEPLRVELEKLDALAAKVQEREGDSARSPARTDETESARCHKWLVQLGHVFRVADDACRALARLLAEPIAPPQPPRWLGPFGR